MDFITLKNITKTFDGVDVLKDINLKISEGETLGILGKLLMVLMFLKILI